MKVFLRTGAGIAAAASLALAPVTASAQANAHDPVLYDMLLDCTALQLLFSQAGDTEAEKTDNRNMAVGFLSAAQALSGTDIKDLGAEMKPRTAKLLDWLNKKDPKLNTLVKSCASVLLVGKNYIEAGKTK
jgi:hypothetical protein